NLDLHFGGHSLVKRERFRFGVHPHTAKIEALLQRDFRRLFDATERSGLRDRAHHRRVLDYWIDKYRLDKQDRESWGRLIPSDLRQHVEGPIKHETTVSDDFNRANQQLGASENWTEVNGDWEIRSNAVQIRTEGGVL